jgi:predicted GIY-YIG superfamily endonuclease
MKSTIAMWFWMFNKNTAPLKMHYVYFAKSRKNNKVYVGYTSKVPKDRVEEHNAGSNKVE